MTKRNANSRLLAVETAASQRDAMVAQRDRTIDRLMPSSNCTRMIVRCSTSKLGRRGVGLGVPRRGVTISHNERTSGRLGGGNGGSPGHPR